MATSVYSSSFEDDDNTLTRRALDVSKDIDFDEIYEKRFKKYLQLVAKPRQNEDFNDEEASGAKTKSDDEKYRKSPQVDISTPPLSEQELLRRMNGRRRQRSSTIGNGLDIEDASYSESDFTEDEREALFYRPFGSSNNRNSLNNALIGRKCSSVKDLSSRERFPRRSSVQSEKALPYNDRMKKRLSVKVEMDEDADFSDDSSSSSFSGFSSSPQLQRRQKQTLRRRALPHAHSVDNLAMYSPPRPLRTLTRMRSSEDLISSSESTSSYTNLHSTSSYTNLHSTSSYNNFHIRRPSSKGTISANLMLLKNNMLTSSHRNLADRNVRENSALAEPSKTLKTSSPYLERRLAEAKQRQTKRTEAMRKLDTDFTKAKEIMKKYKSTENLLTNGDLNNDLEKLEITEPRHYTVI